MQDGNVIQEFPEIKYDEKMYSLFTVISPERFSACGCDLKPHKLYKRYIISSYRLIVCLTIYHICSDEECKKHLRCHGFSITSTHPEAGLHRTTNAATFQPHRKSCYRGMQRSCR